MEEENKELNETSSQNSGAIEVKTDSEIHFEIDKTKSVNEQAKDLVNLAATKKAVEDKELVNDITELKKEELRQSAKTQVKEEQAKSKDTEKKLQNATYGIYEGIADLIGLKKPLPQKMLNVLMVILIPFLVLYYFVIGFVTGIINITMDCVNSVVLRFAEFTKPAKKIIIFLLIAALSAAVVLVVLFLLRKYEVISF